MPRSTRSDNRGTLRRRSLPEMVVDQLGHRIVRGEFTGAGGLPTETALSAEFGISRNTSRETGIPKGLPYLTGFVTHFEIQAELAD